MKLTQFKDTISIDNLNNLKIVIIEYTGSFLADVVPDSFVSVNGKSIIINLNSVSNEDVLMRYSGNIKIRNVKVFFKTGGVRKIPRVVKTDFVNKITSKWDFSQMKYTDYNKSFTYSAPQESFISFRYKGKPMLKNYKDIYVKNLSKFKNAKLNKIRGNDVIK